MTFPRAYRNKMSLVVENVPGETRIGFYQARSHALVPISGCPVVLPQLDAAIKSLHDATRAPDTGGIFAGVKHAIMRMGAASGQAVLSLTTDRQSPAIAVGAINLARKIMGV